MEQKSKVKSHNYLACFTLGTFQVIGIVLTLASAIFLLIGAYLICLPSTWDYMNDCSGVHSSVSQAFLFIWCLVGSVATLVSVVVGLKLLYEWAYENC